MAMKTLLLTISFNICLISCNKYSLYSLVIVYNGNTRYSDVILTKNLNKIDSIRIMDYYGTSKIKEIEDSTWHVSHIERCGTDCSLKIQYIFKVKNEKIVNSLALPLSYEDIEMKDTLFISNITKDNIKIVHYTFYNYANKDKIINEKLEYTLNFDKYNKIYYNDSLIHKGIKYKALSINGDIYPYINNNWGHFKGDSIYIINEY